jgi:D-amino-acid dehydrogenase
MEFGGDVPRFDQRRVDAIVASLGGLLDLDLADHFDPWAGSRPMSPDGLPLLGRPRGIDNLLIAGGHGMYGLSLAPSTALAISELIVEGRSPTDLSDFRPDRFSLRSTPTRSPAPPTMTTHQHPT